METGYHGIFTRNVGTNISGRSRRSTGQNSRAGPGQKDGSNKRPPVAGGNSTEQVAVHGAIHIVVVLFAWWLSLSLDQPPIGQGDEYGDRCLHGRGGAFNGIHDLAQDLDAAAYEEDDEGAIKL